MNNGVGVKKKNDVRFNIIDFLIIIAVLASVSVLIFRSTISDFVGNVVYNDDAAVTFTVREVSLDQAQMLKKGDKLYTGSMELGEVVSVTYTNSMINVDVESGEGVVYQRVADPEKYDVTVTVSSVGAFFEDGYHLAGEMYLGVGKNLTVYSDNYSCNCIITAIS